MAFRIFIDNTVVRIIDEDGRNEPLQFNPAHTKYYIKDGRFIFYDGVEGQDFNRHGWEDFRDEAGNSFANEDHFISYLNHFICSVGGATHYNPLPTMNVDHAGRLASNTVFGEAQTGIRRSTMAAMFIYGYPEGDAKPEIANGGYITVADALLSVGTSSNTAGYARIANKKSLRYIPGYEAYIFFTAVFSPGKANSYQRAGIFDANNGFFIGYEGTVFSIVRRRNGVDYPQAVDMAEVFKYHYDYDPTKGNIYKISFGYLGFATITFEVLGPNRLWYLLGAIEYPNAHTETHITNTNLPPAIEVRNSGNGTDLVLKTGSFSGGIVDGGGSDPGARRFSFAQSAIAIAPTYQMVITFRNKTTFNSLTNYISGLLLLLNPATDISKNSVWEFRRDMTVTNIPTWTDVNTSESVIEYSTDATVTADTGILLFAWSMGKTDRLFEDMTSYNVELFPGESITLIVKTPLGTAGTIDLALRWKELF